MRERIVVAPGVVLPDVTSGDWVVGAVVLDRLGRAFVQRRAPDCALFPGCWDVVGGHVEPGEDVITALGREMLEETGWRLVSLRRFLGCTEWTVGGVSRREADYVVTVDGDLDRPRLQPAEHTEFRWVSPAELDVLRENREPGDELVHDLLVRALSPPPHC